VWGWNGTKWQLVGGMGVRKIVAPLAFDSKRQRTVMFGGNGDSDATDGKLCSLDKGTWRLVKDVPYLERADPSLAYDSKRDRLVLFGGRRELVIFADTWEFDGSDWKPTFMAGPSLRSSAAVVYDSARGVTVLYGGFRPLAALGDTWEWNGEKWKLVSESGPGPRSWPGLAYDSKRKRTILFGGEDEKGQFYSDTWAWDGKVWTRIATKGAPARIQFAMGYDSVRDRIVLFGGVNNKPQRILNDLWEFDGTRWTQKQPKTEGPNPSPPTPLQTSVKPAQVIARLEERVPRLMKEADVPGLAIALVRGGELVWHHGFGVKNSKTKESVDDTTVFEAASLSKPVFAYAVLKLVDEGKFDLDKPLNQYLPGNYDVGDDARLGKLTARHVLSHTTGFPNWRGNDKLKIHFTPGERFSYSGEGFVYLAKVIEHITGEKFNDFMKRTVFDPLGMASSSYVWRDDYDKLVTFRHNVIGEPGGQGKPPAGQAKTGNAAGSLNTTARDYGRFVAAILKGTGLKPQMRKLMLTPQVQVRESGPNSIDRPQAKPVPDVAWGIGWGLQTTKDGVAFWHWGDNGDCKAFVVAFDKPKLAVVFFANSANGLSIAREIVAEAVGGAQPALDWLNYDRYDSPRRALFKDIRARGAAAALRDHRAKRDERPADALSEKQMNDLGYDLLRLKRFDDALEVFKLNVSLHPDSWNAYDSLAEGYEAAGDKASAVKNFKRSLELNPKNGNAVEHLKKLAPEQAPAFPPKDGAKAKRDDK
jgi:CubicO group peptidase (beta-lactamase class C family)